MGVRVRGRIRVKIRIRVRVRIRKSGGIELVRLSGNS
jgi:hypothetical protein